MGEHKEKQFPYLSQKQGRATPLERKAVGVWNEEHWRGEVTPFIQGKSFQVFLYL